VVLFKPKSGKFKAESLKSGCSFLTFRFWLSAFKLI